MQIDKLVLNSFTDTILRFPILFTDRPWEHEPVYYVQEMAGTFSLAGMPTVNVQDLRLDSGPIWVSFSKIVCQLLHGRDASNELIQTYAGQNAPI